MSWYNSFRTMISGSLLAGTLCFGASAQAALVYNFSDDITHTHNAPLSNPATYSAGVGTPNILAYGFFNSNPGFATTGNPIVFGNPVPFVFNNTLYSKNAGGNENGLGINQDPTGDHEIISNSFVKLNLSNLTAVQKNNLLITFNSTTNGESWKIYGSDNTTGFGANRGNTLLLSGNDEIFHYLNLQGFNYISIQTGGLADNILLDKIMVVPEPATYLTLGSCLLAMAFLKRRKAVKALAG